MRHIKTLSELHEASSYPPPEHPLLSLVRCDGSCCNPGIEHTSDFYMIGFKKMKSGTMLYGKTSYDHDRGSMSFVKPRQIMSIRNIELEEDGGFLMYIHEDYLNGHPLHAKIAKYGFFDYEVNEALHLSPKEEQIIRELYDKIEAEYYTNQDEYSREIILTHIDSILNYSQRFYKRQFLHRIPVSGKTVSRFSELLSGYVENGLIAENGLPTVQLMAEKLNVSSRYLSDMLKLETGKTAIELIHIHLISEAKNRLTGDDGTVAEIAHSLGFENPPYFSRLFKKEVGITPNAFKKLHLN